MRWQCQPRKGPKVADSTSLSQIPYVPVALVFLFLFIAPFTVEGVLLRAV